MEALTNWVFIPLMVVLLAVSFYEPLRSRVLSWRPVAALERRLHAPQGKAYWVVFALVMLTGVFVRCYRFAELPLGLNQDGTMAGVEAYCLLNDGVDQYGISWPTYFTAWGFSQMSTLYSYLLIPFIRVLGLTRFALRLPMLLVSLAMLPLVWDLARRVAGRGYALLALVVMAINPWQILQSRWALEANLMPHLLMTAMYLLLLGGRGKRWCLYLSMVCFGLTPYAYGVACFSVPLILLLSAVFYVARKKVGVVDLLVCIVLFAAVAGPYIYTMLINAFGWETAKLGPITMPYFEESLRTNDIALMQENPYKGLLAFLPAHFGTYLYYGGDLDYNVISWAHTLYRFMPPVLIVGTYRIWRERRALAMQGVEDGRRDGLMLILIWLGGAVLNGMVIGGVVNRNNVVFYPLILIAAYTLFLMGKKMRSALAIALVMLTVSFAGLCVTYFTDEQYQNDVGIVFHDGLQQALTDTWGWDYDHYYLTITGASDRLTFMRSQVMFAHKIDYSMLTEETELNGPDGNPNGWYFTERYLFTDFTDFEPNPMDCAVYIVTQKEKSLFAPEHYLITDYGEYVAIYPRYWAE